MKIREPFESLLSAVSTGSYQKGDAKKGVQDDDRRELIHYSFPLC